MNNRVFYRMFLKKSNSVLVLSACAHPLEGEKYGTCQVVGTFANKKDMQIFAKKFAGTYNIRTYEYKGEEITI